MRLLALFRLLYEGCTHERLLVPAYGGGLFAPGDPESDDPVKRALYIFEQSSHSDAIVYRILELLTRSRVRVRQGRGSTWVEAPVDFSDLSSEYIGILYEGLLDFELRQAAIDSPIVFLNLGDQPALPLSRLEGMDDKTLSALVEKLKQKAKGETEETEESPEDEEEPDAIGDEEAVAELDELEMEPDADRVAAVQERSHQWAVRAGKAGKLVPKPKGKKADDIARYEQAVNQAARLLVGDAEAAKPSLSRKKAENEVLHREWRTKRKARSSYADRHHPFIHQGSADINTYKMFLELGHALLQTGGYLGLIVPSGLYSDKGATALRTLFLSRCRWQWLFGFENRDGIFTAVDSRFKFCPVIVQKGGETESILVAFMQQSLKAWEEAVESHLLTYPRKQIEQLSPESKTILEICFDQDLHILKKIYENAVLIGQQEGAGWEINYGRELEMTEDSTKFPPLPAWENLQFRPNSYGLWLNSENEIALPLYEGRMIGQFDFSQKRWISGKGRSAVWKDVDFAAKEIYPQFLLSKNIYNSNSQIRKDFKFSVMRISSSTNERTVIASVIPPFPSQHSIFTGTVQSSDVPSTLILTAFLNSFVFDFVVRRRCVGVNVTAGVLDESPLPRRNSIEQLKNTFLVKITSALSIPHLCFSIQWLELKKHYKEDLHKNWFSNWAITPHERLRLRSILDAVVAHLYGLDTDDFAWILRDCDHPIERVNNKAIAHTFDPKGFWRVDKDKPPELRHTVLSQVAFQTLSEIGLEAFLNLSNGEGWMLPETLRLADYGLGNSDRAHESVPVAEKMGDRFLAWQLEGTPEDSWKDCDRHAENLKLLLGNQPNAIDPPTADPPLLSDRQLTLLPDDTTQLNLFDPS